MTSTLSPPPINKVDLREDLLKVIVKHFPNNDHTYGLSSVLQTIACDIVEKKIALYKNGVKLDINIHYKDYDIHKKYYINKNSHIDVETNVCFSPNISHISQKNNDFIYESIIKLFNNNEKIKETLSEVKLQKCLTDDIPFLKLIWDSPVSHWKKLGLISLYISKLNFITVTEASDFVNTLLQLWKFRPNDNIVQYWVTFTYNLIHGFQSFLKDLQIPDSSHIEKSLNRIKEDRHNFEFNISQNIVDLFIDEAITQVPVLYDGLNSCNTLQKTLLSYLEDAYSKYIYKYNDKSSHYCLNFKQHKKHPNLILRRLNNEEDIFDLEPIKIAKMRSSITPTNSYQLMINSLSISNIPHYHKVFGVASNFLFKIHNAAVAYKRGIIHDSKLKKGPFTNIFETILITLIVNEINQNTKCFKTNSFEYVYTINPDLDYRYLDIKAPLSNEKEHIETIFNKYFFWKEIPCVE